MNLAQSKTLGFLGYQIHLPYYQSAVEVWHHRWELAEHGT